MQFQALQLLVQLVCLLTQLSVDEVGILPFVLAAIALFLATINVVGGFVVSHRMLEKFRGKK
jgi:NAD/NADP transhydrogenase alpha subunit